MKGKITIAIAFLCLLSMNTYAKKNTQTPKDTITTEVTCNDLVTNDSVRTIIDSLETIIESQKSLTNEYIRQIETLSSTIQNDSVQLDSLTHLLQTRENELMTFKSNQGFIDTCLLKISLRTLSEAYNKKRVDEAIICFDKIYSTKLKQDLSMLPILLREYEKAYQEFILILSEAQKDDDRKSPFACDQYKKKYIDKIKSMSYYKTYFTNKNWYITYLNDQITTALDKLNNHSNNKYADFRTILNTDNTN